MTDQLPAVRDERTAVRWLAAQQELAGRAAHEIKNTLNGVAVNLEVVRTRLARPGVQAEQVQRFAESAAAQLELLTRQVEALLAIARAARDPIDVGSAAAGLLALRPVGQQGREPEVGVAITDVDGSMVRLLLARALDNTSACEVDTDVAGRPRVRVTPGGPLDPVTTALATAGGVAVLNDKGADGLQTLTLIFPARGHQTAETEI